MCPERKNRPQEKARNHRQRRQRSDAGWIHRARPAVTPPRGDEPDYGPGQKRAEQDHVGQAPVRQQVRKGPQLDAGIHRMPDHRLDVVARHIRSRHQHKGEQHQQRGEMPGEQRRIVEDHRHLPRLAVTPDHQRETGQRQQGVNPLPGIRTDTLDRARAPAVGDDAHGMDAEEKEKTEHEIGHGCAWTVDGSQSWRTSANVAQMLELPRLTLPPRPMYGLRTVNPQVLGSSPGRGVTELVADLGLCPATPAGLLSFWDRYTESPQIGIG